MHSPYFETGISHCPVRRQYATILVVERKKLIHISKIHELEHLQVEMKSHLCVEMLDVLVRVSILCIYGLVWITESGVHLFLFQHLHLSNFFHLSKSSEQWLQHFHQLVMIENWNVTLSDYRGVLTQQQMYSQVCPLKKKILRLGENFREHCPVWY